MVNRDGTELHHVSGMAESYAECVDGFKVGSDSLACGLAVHTGCPVITPDVLNDPLWQPWMWLAKEYDFRGCWSFPVETEERRVVGTLALDFPTPRQASPQDLEAAATLTRAAAIIISRYLEGAERGRAQWALRESEVRFREFGEASSDVLWIRDIESMAIEYLSPAFRAVYGESRAQMLGGDDLQRWTDLIHPEDRADVLASLE